MNLTELTLEVARKFRQHASPSEVVNLSKAIPRAPLHWMIEKLSIDNAVMYIYPTVGREAVKKRIYGNITSWGLLDKEIRNIQVTENSSKILQPVTCISQGKRRTHSLIGYLGFSRNRRFTVGERKAISDVADFLGDYMYGIFQISCMNRYHRAIKRINEIMSQNKQAGTYIKNLQGVVHRAIRASASYFCIFHENTILMEYYQRNTWNRPHFPDKYPGYKISYAFARLCETTNFFQWRQEPILEQIVRTYIPAKEDRSEYLIAVTKNESVPIALWIFEFGENQLLLFELYRDLIQYASQQARKQAGFLFQRRTQELIVEPIFQSRNTRVEQDLAFILMPFSEDWSHRIWEKLVKPTVAKEGLRAMRADDLYGRDIMEDIWKGILTSRVVIADITARNANVFYELGLAHTLGKPVILLTQHEEDIPFDLNRYRHIIYEDNMDGYKKLKTELRASLREVIHSFQ